MTANEAWYCVVCGGLDEKYVALQDMLINKLTEQRDTAEQKLQEVFKKMDVMTQEALVLAARDEGDDVSESEAPRGTICKCGSAKTYHRDIDKRDHEYETRYPARRARSDLASAPAPLDGLTVERLARALVHEADSLPDHTINLWDILSERHRDFYRSKAEAVLAALRDEGETPKPERLAPSVYSQGHGKPDRCDEHGDIYRDLSIVGHLVRSHGLTYREFVALQEADRIRGIEPFNPHDHDCDAINTALVQQEADYE